MNRKLIILLFLLHAVGVLGMLSPWQSLFLWLTPFHLMLSLGAILLAQEKWSLSLWRWIILVGIAGYGVEVLGVKTGQVFGTYWYGATLGPHLFEVPPIIGVNWIMLSLASAAVVSLISKNKWFSSIAAAALMVGLDSIIEPVAIQLDFWSWEGNHIPLQNFIAWFVVALVFQLILHSITKGIKNIVAIWLFVFQLAFFTLLNLLL